MKHRLFVALPISEQLQNDILAWRRSYTRLPVRWLAGKNLHVTLVPPWYTEDVDMIAEKLKDICSEPFEVVFRKVAYGPTSREPRLIWAEGETPQKLNTLKEHIERTLGVTPERRSFKLHLTLARFRPETFSSFPIKHLDERVVWQQKCRSFVLMESHLSRAGADYEIRAVIPLL